MALRICSEYKHYAAEHDPGEYLAWTQLGHCISCGDKLTTPCTSDYHNANKNNDDWWEREVTPKGHFDGLELGNCKKCGSTIARKITKETP